MDDAGKRVSPKAESIFVAYAALATITSLPAFAKHTAEPVVFTIGYAVVLTIGAWLLRAIAFEQREYLHRLWIVLCVGLAALNALVYPRMRGPGVRSSAPDALIDPGRRLLEGLHPYAQTLFDGAPASPGPAWIAAHVPLTAAGLIWLVVPAHLGLAAYMVSRYRLWAATPFVLFLLALPSFLQMSLTGHDLFAVGCAMVTTTLGVYQQALKPTRAWWLWSAAAGVIATARVPLIVFVAALGILALRTDRRFAIKFVAVAAGVALASHGGVYLWGQLLGIYYQPFHVFGRAGGGAGIPVVVMGAMLSLLVAVALWLRGTTNAAMWLCFIWATTGLPFVAVGLGERINLSHLGWSGWEGKIYAGFGISLLVAAMLLSSDSSQRSASDQEP